ncbi:MAG TPA: peptidoglycan-binding domain-containing protein [Pseudolabrys sp.]|nr:peptidoglycan-binding domain-containing protein [Pseudolabrys sp.]
MRSRSRRRHVDNFSSAGRLAAAIGQHPRESVGILMATAAVFAIFVNALFLQHGPHPAPIFAARPQLASPAPVALPRPRAAEPAVVPAAPTHNQAQIVGDIQRELGRRGFYDGAADGIWGARTDAAARDFAQGASLKINVEASEAFLHAIVVSAVTKAQSAAPPAPARNDPIAALIAPTQQVLAVQRALADFGYGQIKPTGVYDPPTKAAIEKFERDRRLPVTGVISEPLVRELSAVTGRPLE